VDACHHCPVSTGLLLVDDHAGYRAVARALLAGQGMTVIGEAENGPSAVEATQRLHPDVVLLDIHLPGEDGFAVAERLAVLPSAPAVILISSRSIREVQARLAGSAAIGFLPKDRLSATAIEELLG
jgi:DNA-binding NarL/FixJ family response regulator